MYDFSKRLEILIKENKTKKKDLAEAIGLTPAAITEMVKGRSKSTLPTIRAIAAYYHVNPVWLEYGTGEIMESLLPETTKLVRRIPVLGNVPAGFPRPTMPILAEEATEYVCRSDLPDDAYALRV